MNTVLTNNYKLVKSGIAIAIATLATVILVVLLSSHTVAADTSLEPGDIAIIGFNFDNPDEYAFVLLVDIKAGASITFTDNGWYSAGGFRGGEGAETWTANTALSAGTVVTKSTTGMNLSADGDQILAYQGSNGNPTFVYALNSESVGWQTDATSSNTSALPTGLINGETAIALDEIDNAIYDAGNGTSGARAELLALVGDKANWTGHNSDTQTMPSGPFSVTLHALSISKAVTPTTGIDYYSNVTYTVVLGNSTALSDTHVLFTDTLPAEVDFARWIDQPPGAIENNGAITWTGTITDGESISFSFIVVGCCLRWCVCFNFAGHQSSQTPANCQ